MFKKITANWEFFAAVFVLFIATVVVSIELKKQNNAVSVDEQRQLNETVAIPK